MVFTLFLSRTPPQEMHLIPSYFIPLPSQTIQVQRSTWNVLKPYYLLYRLIPIEVRGQVH